MISESGPDCNRGRAAGWCRFRQVFKLFRRREEWPLLTGPGRVWLQSLPLANLAHALSPYLPKVTERVGATSAGGILSSLFRNLVSK